jgi:fructose-bisphosphate aldolase class I
VACQAKTSRLEGTLDVNSQQLQRMEFQSGFIAALDQSGGSTPRALALYGVPEDSYSGDREMFDLMHAMRSRIVTSPCFSGDRILAAILFEDTLERQFDGDGAADYLWRVKNVMTFLKVDKGLAEQVDGVQMMRPLPDLDSTLARAREKGVFGTKMRSVIKLADAAGIARVVSQQFAIAQQVRGGDLMPILEPEIDIHSPQKQQAEVLLKAALREQLGLLGADDRVMLKLTLPDVDGFYTEFVEHPNVVRVAGLSGGYSREQATGLLARNPGMVASFSRALTEGLSAQQSDEEFEARLSDSIDSIFSASTTEAGSLSPGLSRA